MARSATRTPTTVPLPDRVPPQLTQLVDAAPDGDGWLHELKYDGYRMMTRRDRGAVKLLTRTGLDSHGGLKSRGLDRQFSVFQTRSLSPL
jgi:bifunctional non-homologous end joining protein LigD